jgi:hypothetical protein
VLQEVKGCERPERRSVEVKGVKRMKFEVTERDEEKLEWYIVSSFGEGA